MPTSSITDDFVGAARRKAEGARSEVELARSEVAQAREHPEAAAARQHLETALAALDKANDLVRKLRLIRPV